LVQSLNALVVSWACSRYGLGQNVAANLPFGTGDGQPGISPVGLVPTNALVLRDCCFHGLKSRFPGNCPRIAADTCELPRTSTPQLDFRRQIGIHQRRAPMRRRTPLASPDLCGNPLLFPICSPVWSATQTAFPAAPVSICS
jgi:hypothetical protein